MRPYGRASVKYTHTAGVADTAAMPTAAAPVMTIRFANKPLITLARPDAELFRKQLANLRSYADQRSDRSAEIMTQLGFPSDYFAPILGLNGDTNRHGFELMAATQMLAAQIHMIAKHHLACRRPDKRGASVLPMIQTPAHGTFPSGHATEAFATATVLAGLVDDLAKAPADKQHFPDAARIKALLFKQAERIAVNRTVAGVHFPIDSWAGAALGEAVGQIVLAKCMKGSVQTRSYTARDTDFRVADFGGAGFGGADASSFGLQRLGSFTVAKSALFAWLWGKAMSEFRL